MASSDLPVEIWLEILAYFPPSFVLKMIGVSRVLFELALNYKYEEVRLISDDKPSIHLFKQLKYENVAQRVRYLYLRPAFLPAMDDAYESHNRTAGCFAWMNFFGPSSISASNTEKENNAATDKFLQLAGKSLAGCSNLREMTIVVHDHVMTPSFSLFLGSVWKTIGKGFRKLSVQITPAKIPILLECISNEASKLPNVDSFDLVIMNSRFPISSEQAVASTNAIMKFFPNFNSSLTHISLSSLAAYDLTPLFENLGEIPNLKKFELSFIMSDSTLSQRHSLTQFLSRNKDNLEHLVLDPHPRFNIFSPEQDSLYDWLKYELSQIKLPRVRTLQIGMCSRSYSFPATANQSYVGCIPTKLVPRVLPNLQNLIVHSDSPLDEQDVKDVIQYTNGVLESLDISVGEFTPEMLDLFANKLPNLQSLSLGYRCTSITSYIQHDGVWYPGYELFSIASRRYPDSKLDRIRVGYLANCKEIHPVKKLSQAIEKTVGHTVEKDLEARCFCSRFS